MSYYPSGDSSFDRSNPAGPSSRGTYTAPSLGRSGHMGSPSRNTQLSAHNFNESSLSPARTKKPRDERLEALLQIREQTLQDSVARGLETYRRKKEEAAREKEDRFNSLVEELEAGKAELLPRTERTVQHHQQWRRKKAKDTYEAWKSGVFEPIQRAIKESADARPIWEIEERLRSNYEEYLRVTNEKAGVYRDIILTDDYDPLKTRSATIKVAPRIRDPMKVELNKTMRERMQMGNPGKPSQGRDTFDTTWWDKVEATPHGHQVPVRDPSYEGPSVSKSRVVFDHFRYPRGAEGTRVVEELYRTGAARKPVASAKLSDPSLRENMFEVIRHDAAAQSVESMQQTGRAQTDLWLSAKGKLRLDGPEIKTGRPNLFPVLHQVPPSDHDNAADIWLNFRGKARPPGPEERIGRKGLFEVVQPIGRPEKVFNPRGDLDLEQIYLMGKKALAEPKGKSLLEGSVPECLVDVRAVRR